MPEKGIRSTYSQSPFQIYICDDSGVISTGTAFLYRDSDESFLVTNWHNVSGKHFLSKEPLSQNPLTARFPTHIKAKLSTYVDGDNVPAGSFTTVAHRINIYDPPTHQPLWYEHPILGSECDVIALPFPKPDYVPECMHNHANKISSTKIPVKPGNTVFIIGYPKSISIGFGLPIWKSGFIASEPHYDVTIDGEISEMGGLSDGKNLPAFFIDSLTREGLSGSPVFSSFFGMWDMTDPYKDPDPNSSDFWSRNDVAIGGNATQFVGIYSGRLRDKEDKSALGLCWREETIIDVCRGKKLGTHPHIIKNE